MYLAEEKRMVLGVEIAEKMQIPPAYLITIMKSLKQAGFVSVKRGNSGGYMLTKHPSEITLWDIMVVMEGSMQIDRNLESDVFSAQKNTGMGNVRAMYRSIQVNLEDQLKSVTLEDLAG